MEIQNKSTAKSPSNFTSLGMEMLEDRTCTLQRFPLFQDQTPPSRSRLAQNADSVLVANLNSTSNDIVTANAAANNIAVMLGNGNGSFGAPTYYNVATIRPMLLRLISPAMGLKILSSPMRSSSISVLLGKVTAPSRPLSTIPSARAGGCCCR